MNSYARPPTSIPGSAEAFLDPNLSSLRGFRSHGCFWDQHTTDAMAFRDQKFKVYNNKPEGFAASAPKLETHYEDHFAAGSRQPRFPRLNIVIPMVPQLPAQWSQPQQSICLQLRIQCLTVLKLILMMWVLRQLGLWDWGIWSFGLAELCSGFMLVMIGAVSIAVVGCALVWLETNVEGEME